MRHPQLIVYERDGRLAALLEPLADRQRWSLHTVHQPERCLGLLARGGPAVLVLKVGRDLETELGLLDRATWLYPDQPVIVVGDVDHGLVAGLAWDLGAAHVVLPPQPAEALPRLVIGLMGSGPSGTPGEPS